MVLGVSDGVAVALIGIAGVAFGAVVAAWFNRSQWRRERRLNAASDLLDAFHGYDVALSGLEPDGSNIEDVRQDFREVHDVIGRMDNKIVILCKPLTIQASSDVLASSRELLESLCDDANVDAYSDDRWNVTAWRTSDIVLSRLLNAARREQRWWCKAEDFRTSPDGSATEAEWGMPRRARRVRAPR
jgi:hypothetical protein